jgi:hypothetical protein
MNLDFHRAKFNRVCQLVFDRLMAGERLTVRQCAIDGISSLPRRLADLRAQGVYFADTWENGVKVWEMREFHRKENRQHFGP